MSLAPFISIMTFAKVEHGIPIWFIYLCWGVSIIDFIYLSNLIISDRNKSNPHKVTKKKIKEIVYEQEEKK